jgi:hypothetical protein
LTPSHIRYRSALGVVVASAALAVYVALGGRLTAVSGTLNDVLVVEAGLLGFLIAAVTIASSMPGVWFEREINRSVFAQIIGASIKTTKHLLFATSVNLLALAWLRIPTLTLYAKGAAAGSAWVLFGLSMSLTVGCLNMLGSLVLETNSPLEGSKRGSHP